MGGREGKQRRIASGANKERGEGRMKGKARGGDAGIMDGRAIRQGRKGGRTRTKRATAERREGLKDGNLGTTSQKVSIKNAEGSLLGVDQLKLPGVSVIIKPKSA